ncbi:MAG: RNA polymerase sigma factor region1.1 domain-containing protein, partial [Opitutaceae bacterium]
MPRKQKPATDQSEAVEEVVASQPAPAPAEAPELPEGVEAVAPGGINEKIRQLIRLSKEQGYLTFDDINEALPESVENQEEID